MKQNLYILGLIFAGIAVIGYLSYAIATKTHPATTEAIAELINQKRSEAGLHPSERDAKLDQAAAYITDELRNNANFSFETPEQKGIAAREAVRLYGHGDEKHVEVIDVIYIDSYEGERATAEKLVDAWMGNIESRAVLLSPAMTFFGVSTIDKFTPSGQGGTHGIVFVFASR